MVLNHPFFASLAMRLTLKEDRTCRTAWTDGKTFGYNPDYINILPQDKLVGLSAHTVMHPACNHHLRRKDKDPEAWNKACDYVINPILLDAGLVLPDGFLWDDTYIGKTAEQVYKRLIEGSGDEENSEPDPAAQKSAPDKERYGYKLGPGLDIISASVTAPGCLKALTTKQSMASSFSS